MKNRTKTLITQIWAVANAIFLSFQPLFAVPLLLINAPAVYAQPEISAEDVQLTFESETNDFHIRVESDEALPYTLVYDDLSYEEPVQQAVTGMLQPTQEGIVEAYEFAGTCSGTECVPVPFDNGRLQIGTSYEVSFYQDDEFGIVQKQGNTVIYSDIQEDVQYGLEGFDNFSVTFSELPKDMPAALAVRAIYLDEETIEKTNALSDVAFEITTNLENGSYTYDLELPPPTKEFEDSVDVVVKFSDSVERLSDDAGSTTTDFTSNEVRVSDLNHMTVFVVTNASPVNTGAFCVANADTPADCYNSLGDAVANASANGTIKVENGVYTENQITIPVGKDGLTIEGESRAGVRIATSVSANRGFDIKADNVTLKNMTLIDNSTSTNGYHVKVYDNDGFSIENVSMEGTTNGTTVKRGGLDFNTVTNSTVKNVSITNYYKNGYAITSTCDSPNTSENAYLEDVSVSNVGWNGFAFQLQSGPSCAPDGAAITGVVFAGSNSASDVGQSGFYVEGTSELGISGPGGERVDLGTFQFSGTYGYGYITNYQQNDLIATQANFNGISNLHSYSDETERNTVESFIIHDCEESPYPHGKCNQGVDLDTEFGSVEYLRQFLTKTECEATYERNNKMPICHATNSVTNPYVLVEAACSAIYGGHLEDDGTPRTSENNAQDHRDDIPASFDDEGKAFCPAPPTTEYQCEGWDCIEGDHVDFVTTGRFGGSGWKNAIDNPDVGNAPEVTDGTNLSTWPNGLKEFFSVSYDPTTGEVTYIKGEGNAAATWKYTYDSAKAFSDILFFAKGNNKDNTVQLTELTLNGTSVGSIDSGKDYIGLKLPLTDAEQIDGFIATGYATLNWADKPQDEIPAFHVYALNTHDLITPQTISGFKYNSETQQPIPGWKVELCRLSDDFNVETDDPTQAECESVAETTTDESGYYEFKDLITGIYKVTEENKPGFVFVNPSEGYHVVDLTTNNDFSTNNLLLNGGFETPEVSHRKNWNIFENGTAGLGWLVDWVSQSPGAFDNLTRPENGWLELHKSVNNWSPYEGKQYTELDSDWSGPDVNVANEPASVIISQDVGVCSEGTAEYAISFAYSPRPGHANNSIQVLWNGTEVFSDSVSGVGNSNTVWQTETIPVSASGGLAKLEILETGTQDSFGMFVDAVSVVQTSACESEDPSYDFYNKPQEPQFCSENDEFYTDAWASVVSSSNQGTTKSGGSIGSSRTNPDSALGSAEATGAEGTFFSLGLGGTLTVAFTGPIMDAEGPDISLHEVTNGRTSYPEERAEIEISQDGLIWYSLGFASSKDNDGEPGVSLFDISGTPLSWAMYVRVSDRTDFSKHSGSADGYDVDAIDAYKISCNDLEPDPTPVSVTLCKQDVAQNPLENWTLGLSKDIGVSEAINVDGSGNEIPVSSGDYVLYTSGTYKYGNAAMIADSGFSYRPIGIPFGNNSWVSGDVLGTQGALEVAVEGSNIQWGYFHPAHTYSYFMPNFTDAAISLSIYDNNYTDNVNNGALTATVEEVVAYGQTDESGCVTLENVLPGDYSVFEVPQQNWLYESTTVNEKTDTSYPAQAAVTTEMPEITLTNSYHGSGSISGEKVEDVNANGQDDDEPRLANWTIRLFDSQWNEIASTTTNDAGSYSFDEVPSENSYYVCEDVSEGWEQTFVTGDATARPQSSENCSEITVKPGETATASFGNFKLGYVQGRKYPDSNRNGVPNSAVTEPWIDDWTIRLYKQTEGWEKVDEKVTGHTGNTGQYRFDNLTPGNYVACEVNQSAWEQTGPLLGAHPVDRDGNVITTEVTAVENPVGLKDEANICWNFEITESNQSYGWLQFGNFEYGVIQGRKYLDLNTDGTPDSLEDEPYLNDWTIRLYELSQEDEETSWNQLAEAVTGDTTPADTSGYVAVPPQVDGQFRFDNLPEGSYAVCEVLQEDWMQSGPNMGANPVDRSGNPVGLDSVAIINESPNASEEGATCWQVDIDASGEAYGYTMFGNYLPGTIDGFKYFDENQDGERGEGEIGLEGWTITLSQLQSEYEQVATTSAETEDTAPGYFKFENVPAGVYELCEEDRTDLGWIQTQPVAQLELEEQADGLQCYTVKIDSNGQTETREFGNYTDSELYIQKSNDAWPNDKQVGDTVTFTLKVMAVGGPVANVQVTDVPPEQFEYDSGSFDATSSARGNLKDSNEVTEPTYASPGTWNVGTIAKDEIITLTYTATIQNTADPGVYPDMAWATGRSAQQSARGAESSDLTAVSDPSITAEDNGTTFDGSEGHYGEETFVGTQVAVVAEDEEFTEYAVKRTEEKQQGQVLGASTELPATGARAWTFILAALSILIGSALVIFGKNKRVLHALLIAVALGATSAQAAQAATSVRIEEPYNTSAEYNSTAESNKLSFKVDFVVLNQEGEAVSAQCQMSKDGGAWNAISTIYTVKAGGNSGYCEVSGLTNNSNYNFRVMATATSGATYSEVVGVGIDTDRPKTPVSYSKSTTSCKDVITFKTANDSRTERVEVYRSENATTFTAKPDTRIASISIGPDTEHTYEVPKPDCNKTYYYAIRAFDAVGNASGLIGDTDITVILVESTDGTTTSETNQAGAVPVGESESFVSGTGATGGSTGSSQDEESSQQDASDGSDESAASGDEEPQGSVLGITDSEIFTTLKDYALPIILGIIVLIGFYVLFFYKRK